jgi:putative SOS response-associated peptidase YedK
MDRAIVKRRCNLFGNVTWAIALRYASPMCGRYALYGPISRHRDHFGVPDDGFAFGPRYNLAPGQALPIVRADPTGNRSFLLALWGLIPASAKVTDTLLKPINAKAETAAIKPLFRHAFRQSRVLVPADAFYEWQAVAGQKLPYLIHMKDEQPFGFGGLLEYWRGPAGDVATFTILTTSPNALVAEIHNRMPVIIQPEHYAEWLDPAVTDVSRLHTLIGPYPEQLMEAYRVSKMVNSPANECVELIGRQS